MHVPIGRNNEFRIPKDGIEVLREGRKKEGEIKYFVVNKEGLRYMVNIQEGSLKVINNLELSSRKFTQQEFDMVIKTLLQMLNNEEKLILEKNLPQLKINSQKKHLPPEVLIHSFNEQIVFALRLDNKTRLLFHTKDNSLTTAILENGRCFEQRASNYKEFSEFDNILLKELKQEDLELYKKFRPLLLEDMLKTEEQRELERLERENNFERKTNKAINEALKNIDNPSIDNGFRDMCLHILEEGNIKIAKNVLRQNEIRRTM